MIAFQDSFCTVRFLFQFQYKIKKVYSHVYDSWVKKIASGFTLLKYLNPFTLMIPYQLSQRPPYAYVCCKKHDIRLNASQFTLFSSSSVILTMYLLESFIDHFGYGIFLGVRTCEVFLRLVSIIFLVFFVSLVYVPKVISAQRE